MSRTKYLKSLERDVHAAAKIIDELTRENYELKQLLKSSSTPTRRHETKPQAKDHSF